MTRVLHILIALDQLIYSLVTLGEGMPSETMSSAAWRMKLEGKRGGSFVPLIDWIFSPLEKDHCETSFDNVVSRKYVPEKYKNDPAPR